VHAKEAIAYPHIFENVMNIRNATLAIRHRKHALFEQEHVVSRDYDKQRSGGTPSNATSKNGKSDTNESGEGLTSKPEKSN
jgi:hypothetical protein